MRELLKIENLSYSYHTLSGETTALTDVNFSVSEGEFVAIVAENQQCYR